jgi:hypothetical protein
MRDSWKRRQRKLSPDRLRNTRPVGSFFSKEGHIRGNSCRYDETHFPAGVTKPHHEAFLYKLAATECAYCTQRRVAHHLREYPLPRVKTFATLQLDLFSPALQLRIERLRSGSFVTAR